MLDRNTKTIPTTMIAGLHFAHMARKKRKENYAGSRTPPASIKKRETQWFEVPYAKPPPETGAHG